MGETGESASSSAEPAPFKGFDRTHFGAAASKLVAASVGGHHGRLVLPPAHKHYSLADIEWMIPPPVLNGQFAVASWAFVSDEVDRRLSADSTPRVRRRPDEWKSGDTTWIVDLVGERRGGCVQWLKSRLFKHNDAKNVERDAKGRARAATLEHVKAKVPIVGDRMTAKRFRSVAPLIMRDGA
jgi:hemolysin-activating ACP:hemolysin acyltransferase